MNRTCRVRVDDIRVASSSIKEFVLVREDGTPLPPYEPGSHIRIGVAGGGFRGSRCYSLIKPGARSGAYRIAVHLEPEGQGGSRYMHGSIRIGSALEMAGPQNGFPLDSGDAPRLFVAGGIGISPIMTMAYHAHVRNEPFCLHYVARSADLMPFRSELITAFGDRVFLYFDQGITERGLNLAQLLAEHAGRGPVYVCGPNGMIDAALRLASQLGLQDGTVRFERFSATASVLSTHRSTAASGRLALDL